MNFTSSIRFFLKDFNYFIFQKYTYILWTGATEHSDRWDCEVVNFRACRDHTMSPAILDEPQASNRLCTNRPSALSNPVGIQKESLESCLEPTSIQSHLSGSSPQSELDIFLETLVNGANTGINVGICDG